MNFFSRFFRTSPETTVPASTPHPGTDTPLAESEEEAALDVAPDSGDSTAGRDTDADSTAGSHATPDADTARADVASPGAASAGEAGGSGQVTDSAVESEAEYESGAAAPAGDPASDTPGREHAGIPRQQSAETATDRESGEGAHP